MVKLITSNTSSFGNKVAALLKVAKIDFELEIIDLKNKPDWFLRISPLAKVPIFITENKVALFESNAIIEYIEERYNAQCFSNNLEEKAVMRALCYILDGLYMVAPNFFTEDNGTFIETKTIIRAKFSLFENHFSKSNTKFFTGNTISMVDIFALPLFTRIRAVKNKTGINIFEDMPHVHTWLETLLEDEVLKSSINAINSNLYEVLESRILIKEIK